MHDAVNIVNLSSRWVPGRTEGRLLMTTGTHTNRLELVVFAGLQASGKSTFFRTYFATTHALVSKDLFRNNRNPNRRQTHLIEAALSAGRSVVVDNTNPTTAD